MGAGLKPWVWLWVWLWLLTAGCGEHPRAMGVQLVVRYERTPNALTVRAVGVIGQQLSAPVTLPQDGRPLAAGAESVILLFPDELAGRTVVLDVVGLDALGFPMATGRGPVDLQTGRMPLVGIQLVANAADGPRAYLGEGQAAGPAPQPSHDGGRPAATGAGRAALAFDGGSGPRVVDVSTGDGGQDAGGGGHPHDGGPDAAAPSDAKVPDAASNGEAGQSQDSRAHDPDQDDEDTDSDDKRGRHRGRKRPHRHDDDQDSDRKHGRGSEGESEDD